MAPNGTTEVGKINFVSIPNTVIIGFVCEDFVFQTKDHLMNSNGSF